MTTQGVQFEHERINFVQIGLGTNSTFVHNLAGQDSDWDNNVEWLMAAMRQRDPLLVRGIAVEPVSELVKELSLTVKKLPYVELVEVAMGEHDCPGVDIQVFSVQERDDLLRQVPASRREGLKQRLEYILNMSCIEDVHPWVPEMMQQISKDYDIDLSLSNIKKQKTCVWSWQKLQKECKFKGCEVLCIDTEGYDVKILRSLISHCSKNTDEWPYLIQFETMGHCDRLENRQAEWGVIEELCKYGYKLVHQSSLNSHLVRKMPFSLSHRSRIG